MITVLGVNSALDRSMRTDVVRPGEVMRVDDVRARPGGKGLHVALTCAALGEPVRLVGIIDRRNRADFENVLASAGVEFCGVDVDDEIRTCLAIHDSDGGATEFLEPGPVVTREVRARLMELALDRPTDGPVVLSGSLPRGIEPGIYREVIRTLRESRVDCLLDTSGEPLRLGVEGRPRLVSPNRCEAEGLAGEPVADVGAAARLAIRLTRDGVGVAVISMGSNGVVAGDGTRVAHIYAPVQTAANVVGAGDSLLGGLVVAVRRGLTFEETMRFGVATAAASVLHPEPGILRVDDMERLYPATRVDWLTDGDAEATRNGASTI